MASISDAAGQVAAEILTKIGPEAAGMLWRKFKNYVEKDHGSKVKKGKFQECPIEMFGDKACILVDKQNGEIVLLTADTIQSCHQYREPKNVKWA